MGTIRIEIIKETTSSHVSLYASIPHHINIFEAQQFTKAMADAIAVAIQWREAATLKVSPKAKGGKARAASLSPERRSEIARKAATSRWSEKANGATVI